MSNHSLLDPVTQPKFVNPLPSPVRIDATDGGEVTIEMRETEQWLGLYESPGADGVYGTEDDERLNTTIWGYGLEGQEVTYPGPTLISQSYVPIDILWRNKLPIGTEGGHLLSLDSHIPIMEPIREVLDKGYIPTVTHLHGSHVESASDGHPLAWFTQDFADRGSNWVKETYTYDNSQEAGTLWYHDHAMSITRLNVYAGLTGFNLLRDDNEDRLIDRGVLPSDSYEREIVIQDRRFTEDGELFYSSDTSNNIPGVPNSTGVYGDFILANGMAWPMLEVEPRKYRLRLLNGSDSRFYTLDFDNPNEKIYQIGTDLGFLEQPVALDELVLAPAQRADVIVDFTDDAGEEFILKNTGLGGDSATTGQIMKFAVDRPLSDTPIATVDTDESDGLTTLLRPDDINPPEQTGPTRQLVLFQEREGPHSELLLGTVEHGSLNFNDPVTEKPVLGTTEVWEIYNTTDHPHPIHLHLVNFQLLNRQNFGGSVVVEPEPGTGETKQYLRDIGLFGEPQPPSPSESGLLDTAIVGPREVIRIIATFNRPGEYVWHCHLLVHEDHDMMRPFEVVLEPEPTTEVEIDELLAGGISNAEIDRTDELLAGGLLATEVSESDELLETNESTLNFSLSETIEPELVLFGSNPLSESENDSFLEDNDSEFLPIITEDI